MDFIKDFLLKFKEFRIMAIDQSLNNTGVACFVDNNIYLHSILYKEKQKKSENEIASVLNKSIYNLEELNKIVKTYNINILVMEGYSYGSRGKAMFELGELGGIIKYNLGINNNIPTIIIPPSSHKKYTTGSGNANKDVMLLSVFKKYNIETTNHNIADAVSILHTFLNFKEFVLNREEFNKKRHTQKEKEAIEGLLNNIKLVYKKEI